MLAEALAATSFLIDGGILIPAVDPPSGVFAGYFVTEDITPPLPDPPTFPVVSRLVGKARPGQAPDLLTWQVGGRAGRGAPPRAGRRWLPGAGHCRHGEHRECRRCFVPASARGGSACPALHPPPPPAPTPEGAGLLQQHQFTAARRGAGFGRGRPAGDGLPKHRCCTEGRLHVQLLFYCLGCGGVAAGLGEAGKCSDVSHPPCAGGLAIKGGLPVDNQHACEVRRAALQPPPAAECRCMPRHTRPANARLRPTPCTVPLQYYLVKDESVDVEGMLAALAPKLPVSLDGGV